MPYTENHALLRFGGPAWSNGEQWSCGLRLRHQGGDEPGALVDETQDTIAAVATAVKAYHALPASHFSAHARLQWVELNAISSSTGKYIAPNQPNRLEFAEQAGSQGIAVPQVAVCVTLRGLTNRGPGSRGRWYVPYGNGSADALTSTGVVPQASCELQANAAGTFLSALRSIDSGLGPDAWIPWLFGDGVGGPVDSVISEVTVGNVLDTQRRRRNSLVETHFKATTYP